MLSAKDVDEQRLSSTVVIINFVLTQIKNKIMYIKVFHTLNNFIILFQACQLPCNMA